MAMLFIGSGISSGNDAECRYFWVVRDGLSSPQSVDSLLQRAADAGANGVIVQVVGRGEAYYLSDILPPAHWQGFDDPLAYTVMRAGPLGLEVHAWINAFLVWSAPDDPGSPDHVVNSRPGWFTGHENGRSSLSYRGQAAEAVGLVGPTLSPAYPEVREFVGEIASEIACGYMVDGIHLDYIRYPNSSFGWSEGEREMFFSETGMNPEDDPGAWNDWKTGNVTETVATVRAVLRSCAPHVILSCAVMADPASAVSEFSCDWGYWLREGLVDYALPMAYTSNQATARNLALAVTAENPEKVIYGIGVWNQTVENALTGAEMALSRGAAGVCAFSLNSLPSAGEEVLRDFWGSGSMPNHGVSPAVFSRVVLR